MKRLAVIRKWTSDVTRSTESAVGKSQHNVYEKRPARNVSCRRFAYRLLSHVSYYSYCCGHAVNTRHRRLFRYAITSGGRRFGRPSLAETMGTASRSACGFRNPSHRGNRPPQRSGTASGLTRNRVVAWCLLVRRRDSCRKSKQLCALGRPKAAVCVRPTIAGSCLWRTHALALPAIAA